MNMLEEIVAQKRIDVERHKRDRPLSALRSEARDLPSPAPFASALRSSPMGLIAEVKHRSPSAGIIREPFDPAAIARSYEEAGAQAISVLVDHAYFGGGEEAFRTVRASVSVPLLYKEFVVDPWQVWHARQIGASAVLLIASVLDSEPMAALIDQCAEAGLEPLVEVHGVDEMERVATLPVACVGVNNRDLKTFRVSLDTTFAVQDRVASHQLLISESGIRSSDDVERLHAAGVGGILVGEHLLRQADLNQAVKDLMGALWARS